MSCPEWGMMGKGAPFQVVSACSREPRPVVHTQDVAISSRLATATALPLLSASTSRLLDAERFHTRSGSPPFSLRCSARFSAIHFPILPSPTNAIVGPDELDMMSRQWQM